MNAQRLGAVFEAGLIPFIQGRFLDGHRLYQDNDPKHSPKCIEEFLKVRDVNWWYTPPELPDFNPIELVWGSLKQFLRNHFNLLLTVTVLEMHVNDSQLASVQRIEI